VDASGTKLEDGREKARTQLLDLTTPVTVHQQGAILVADDSHLNL